MDTQIEVVDRLRSAFNSGITIPEKFRHTQLTKLLSMMEENEELILKALHKDLAKPKFEAMLSEIDLVINDLHYTINNFSSWMKPEYASKNLATKLDDCFVRREPLGVVLIIGAWNYPLQLLLVPLIGAIAAGNCAIIKPSEVSAATDNLIAELIPKYLSQPRDITDYMLLPDQSLFAVHDIRHITSKEVLVIDNYYCQAIVGGKQKIKHAGLQADGGYDVGKTWSDSLLKDCYAVVRGGAEETKALLQNRFDHIFYTGSQTVARSILQAASVHLTPVTLELGGKSPCIIYGQVSAAASANRLAWAKFFNAGQSCVAPDYVLCSPAMRDALLPALRKTLEDFYGKDPQTSPDFSRIVSPQHWTRLMQLLKRSTGKVVIGGQSNQEDKYIAPTVVVDVAEDDALMQEEIFGPILPILTVESLEQGIKFLKSKEKPLALYVFSDESSVIHTVLENTSSGGFCSNDGIVHMALPSLPFGGVGASGWGSYHGRWSFETFSHRRACMLRGWAMERLNSLRYPPYADNKLSWLRWTTSAKSNCTLM